MPHQEPVEAPRTRRTRPLRGSRLTWPVGVLLALVLLAGCTGGGGSGQGGGGAEGRGDGGATSQDAGPRTVVVPGKRIGQLAPQRHRQVARRVASVVDDWWDAAFVDADYPRRRYQGSFPGFTRTAAAQAWQQRDLMTSARIGARIEALVPLRRRVAVDVLSTRQVPRGATARVRMDFRTAGEVERRVRVQGRLVLTYLRGGWRVFGFDVTQSPLVPQDAGKPSGTQPGGKR